MSRELMLSPEQARDAARRKLSASHRTWTLTTWTAPVWTLPLRAPTERQVLADPGAAEAWVRSWRAAVLPEGVGIEWVARSWRSVGTQQVPVRLVVDSPDALAGLVGGREARDARRFAARVDRVRGLAGGAASASGEAASASGGAASASDEGGLVPVLRRHAERLTTLPDAEFERLLEVTTWLGSHPVTGLRPRQLPIRGVDSKWFSTHRTLLTALHGALFAGDDASGLGIVDTDPTVRLRVLDPALRPVASLRDLEVPVAQAAGLTWQPHRALIVENQETLLCLPDASGTIAIWGKGFDPTAAKELPWLRDLQILYWGDLDSNGFAILHRYRTHLPQIESLLMDEPTLDAFRDLWVPEPTPARGSMGTLSAAEIRALERLRTEGDVRLEQERIAWAYALERLGSRISFL